ncbi:MAG: YfhO family protein [Clostridiales bacterium]|nr:YfhO family protein [Clostridiales bacterium]
MKNYTTTLANIKKKNYALKTFLLGLLLAGIVFIPFIVLNKGYFLYYGDFNVQQIPFYQMIHDDIWSGKFFWSNTTDLGANTIGSYSFYNLGSPFFWLTMLFPSKFVPRLMGPLLILKFACAAWAGYVYINRYLKNKDYAVLGGILYAFSGFSVYNVFFNHFHEAIIVFPLLLYAVDEYMFEKRRGLLALTVFASCFMNYYFFCGQVIFVIIYWIMCLLCRDYKFRFKEFVIMAAECVIGLAMTAVLLVPSILAVTQNSRVNNPPYGYESLLFVNAQRYMHIIQSFFFPPDIPARPNFTPDSNAKWASVAAYIPMFGMCGVFGFMQMHTRNRLKKLISLLLLFAFVPGLNCAFQLFNLTYYARWFYMLTLVFSLATVKALEDERVNWKRAITWSASITIVITLAIGIIPQKDEDGSWTIGLEKFPERFWAYCAIALIGIGLTAVCVNILRRDAKKIRRVTALASAVCVIYSGYILFLGTTHSYDTHNFVIPYALNNGEELKIDDIMSVRSDFYESMDNMGMYWQIPTIQAFHSIVPGSVMDFYNSVGVERTVGSRPETKYYGLRGLLSCKYLFDCNYDDKFFEDKENGEMKMPGWKMTGTVNGFTQYENEYYVPYGFYYDTFMTEEEYENSYKDNRHLLLLKAMVLSSEDIVKYSDIVKKTSNQNDFTYNKASYFSDCDTLKKNACSKFEYFNNGFKAQITLDNKQDRLVFFSVPYEKGWSAYVNGEYAEIVKANIGFMAVRVPKGKISDIIFKYRTPGLKTGFVITLISAVLFIIYLIICARRGKLKGSKEPQARPFNEFIDDNIMYIDSKKHDEDYVSPDIDIVDVEDSLEDDYGSSEDNVSETPAIESDDTNTEDNNDTDNLYPEGEV